MEKANRQPGLAQAGLTQPARPTKTIRSGSIQSIQPAGPDVTSSLQLSAPARIKPAEPDVTSSLRLIRSSSIPPARPDVTGQDQLLEPGPAVCKEGVLAMSHCLQGRCIRDSKEMPKKKRRLKKTTVCSILHICLKLRKVIRNLHVRKEAKVCLTSSVENIPPKQQAI